MPGAAAGSPPGCSSDSSLHLLALVQEFGSTCLVARAEDGIRGHVFGFVTPDGTGYVHLIATRDDTRGPGRTTAVFQRDLPLPTHRLRASA